MLRHIFYRQFADIRRDEWPRALLLSAFFFLVIATFWILKPIKRGLIINYFGDAPMTLLGLTLGGAEAEQIGKVFNMVAVYGVVILFTFLARRLPRHHLVFIFTTLFGLAFALFAALIEDPNEAVVWTFYVYGDMFNTVMVGLFWAFTNDVMLPEEARRTYHVVGLGGVLGGFVGATVVSTSVESAGRPALLLLCIVPMVAIALIAYAVHRKMARDRRENVNDAAAPGASANTAIEGAKLVFTSKYLLAIVGIIATYELVSNVVDFQLAATVEREITASLAKDEFFGLVGQATGIASIVVQLLVTGFVLQRFGVKTALFFLPLAILLGTTGFVIVPGLLFVASMSVSDNALNYSINQSAKEALYTPTSKDVKYKAKAFIDMFVQRFAKVLSVGLNLLFVATIAGGVRWLSAVVFVMVGFWLYLVYFAGNEFRRRADEPDADPGPNQDARRDAVPALEDGV